jgi:nucleoside-diphosphate-sugar epimerase
MLGDVTDPVLVDRALTGADIVFHLAALIGIPYSYLAPKSYVDVNVMGTVNVLEAARRHNPERVVVTSTSETYGTARYTPIDEAHPLQGQSPYAASKIASDKLAESYHRSFELPVVTVRPFNTYGPRQSARAVIPTIITQALAGDVVRLGSVSPVRDMNFVKDTVAGFCALGACEAAEGQVVNLASGRGVTVGDLAQMILKGMGSSARIETAEERVRPARSEVLELLGDASRARDLTGWKPRWTLDEGLAETIKYFSDRRSVLKSAAYVV